MDITVYLPDELGQRMRDAELKPSPLLREAIEDELRRREALAELTGDVEEHELELVVEDGGGEYVGVLMAKELTKFEGGSVYLTEAEQLVVYDAERGEVVVIEDYQDLRHWLRDDGDYVAVMTALGEKPRIELEL